MPKHRKNHTLSWILIFLIILVITAGTVFLLKLAKPDSTDRSHEEASLPESSLQIESESEPISEEPSDAASEMETPASESSEESVEEPVSIPEPVPMITITIPDRSTFPEIVEILSSASNLTADELYSQADTLGQLLPDPDTAASCYFPLEGYILSGTYELPEDEPILENLVKSSLDRISGLAESDTYTVHEILSMASIIEIESSRGGLSEHYPEQMPHIASVIFNRLNSGMQLQMDVTFQYGYNTLQLHGADDTILSQYNTYDVASLPLGPICSPSEDAVKAVLNPVTSEDLFFVFDENGNYYYAADYNKHLENCHTAGIR